MPEEKIAHEANCQGRKHHQDNLKNLELYLTPLQIQILDKIQKRSVYTHNESMAVVKSHFLQMDYTEEDLNSILRYIMEEAPIIIHFSLKKLYHSFIHDTQYRNVF